MIYSKFREDKPLPTDIMKTVKHGRQVIVHHATGPYSYEKIYMDTKHKRVQKKRPVELPVSDNGILYTDIWKLFEHHRNESGFTDILEG